MPTATTIKRAAENLTYKFNSTDPFVICEGLGIELRRCELGSLKGLYTVQHNISYIVINKDLGRKEAAIICAHELGHDRLHRKLAHSHILDEFELYLINTKSELEANTFAAHLLIPDSAFEAVERYEYDLFKAASVLSTTPELLEIKLRQMPERLFYNLQFN